MLEPTKQDVLRPKTKKNPQQDSLRGAIVIKSNPIPAKWATHKLENYHRSSPTGVKVLSFTSGSPAWGSGNGRRKRTRGSAFEGQRDLITGIPQDWGKQKLHSWRVHIRSCAHQDPGKKAVTSPKSLGQTYLLVLQGFLRRQGAAVAHCGVVLRSTHWCEPSWRLPYFHQDLAPPNSL